jgi:hypothetical protein
VLSVGADDSTVGTLHGSPRSANSHSLELSRPPQNEAF